MRYITLAVSLVVIAVALWDRRQFLKLPVRDQSAYLEASYMGLLLVGIVGLLITAAGWSA